MLDVLFAVALSFQVGTSGIPGPPAPIITYRYLDGSVRTERATTFVYDYRQLNRQQRRCFPTMWRAEHEGTLGAITTLNPNGSTLITIGVDTLGNIYPHWHSPMIYHDATALKLYP